MKYKLIVFDLDGTLIDTLSDIEYIFNYILSINHFPVKSNLFYKKNIGNGVEDLLRKCLPKNFNGDFEELLNSTKKHYKIKLNSKTKIFDGIIPVLDILKKNRIKMAIISNKPHQLALKSVKKYFNLYKMKVIGAGSGYPRKPDPSSLEHLINLYNFSLSDVLFIGDSTIDIKTAHNAEIQCAGVLWGNGTKEEFVKQRANFILCKPKEILQIM